MTEKKTKDLKKTEEGKGGRDRAEKVNPGLPPLPLPYSLSSTHFLGLSPRGRREESRDKSNGALQQEARNGQGGRGRRAQERFFWAGGNASPYSAAPLMGREEEAQSATNMRKRGEKIITAWAC